MQRIIVNFAVCLALFAAGLYSYGQELERTRCENGKWGFKDKNTGNMVISCKYDGIAPFSEGMAAVRLNKKFGFIDKTGKEVIPLKRILLFDVSNNQPVMRNKLPISCYPPFIIYSV